MTKKDACCYESQSIQTDHNATSGKHLTEMKQSFDCQYKVVLLLCIAIVFCCINLKLSVDVTHPKNDDRLLTNRENTIHEKQLLKTIIGTATTTIESEQQQRPNNNDLPSPSFTGILKPILENLSNSNPSNETKNKVEENIKSFNYGSNFSTTSIDEAEKDKSKTMKTNNTKTKNSNQKIVQTTNSNKNNCLNPYGPIPVILMVHGRSGSTVLWQVLSNLTGFESNAIEITGAYKRNTRSFLNTTLPNGEWVLNWMCKMQGKANGKYEKQKREFQRKGLDHTKLPPLHERIVGFQWKPFFDSIKLPRAQEALQKLSNLSTTSTTSSSSTTTTTRAAQLGSKVPYDIQQVSPFIRVVRCRRNPIDVKLSFMKHKLHRKNGHGLLSSKCKVGDIRCLESHTKSGIDIVIENVTEFYNDIYNLYIDENRVDEMLLNYQIPTTFVSYENLFYPNEISNHNGNNNDTTEIATKKNNDIRTSSNTSTQDDIDPENCKNSNDLFLAAEWNKIFQFLNVSKFNWKWKDIQSVAKMASTTPSRSHKYIISNYDEVYNMFKGTDIEFLLRP